jgi:shikimate dehydrogenase
MQNNKAFVIGYPIKHSRSPLIHGYWLDKYKILGSYEKLAVEPAHLEEFLRTFRSENIYCGGNITLPHKENTFLACHNKTEIAEKIRAVNTIWLENGYIFGDNTDVSGFLANLDAETPGWDQGRPAATVVGAGGAARAILVGLVARGISDVRILNRSAGRMLALAKEAEGWGFRKVTTHLLNDASDALRGAGLLVNTTSLGMTGQPELVLKLDGLPYDAVVSDIIYTPLETELLAEAKRRGHRVSSGLGMLLHQAAPGFERWFGVRPEVTQELRDLIVKDLRKAQS